MGTLVVQEGKFYTITLDVAQSEELTLDTLRSLTSTVFLLKRGTVNLIY